MKKIYLLNIVACLLVWTSVGAQQYPIFTNFVINQFGYNPASTGYKKGLELRSVYRKQWAGLERAPETVIGSLSARLGKLPIGLGGFVYGDQSGFLNRTGLNGSVAIHQKLGKNIEASVGATIGFSRFKLAGDFDPTFLSDPTLINAEKGIWVPDLNIGVNLYYDNLFLGFSMPQFNEASFTFSGLPDGASRNELRRNYFGIAGYRHYIGDIYIEPAALVKITSSSPVQVDFAPRAGYRQFWGGIMYRTGVALAFMGGMELKNGFELAYSMDAATNGLSNGGLTSHEITLVYAFGRPKDSDGDGIPDKEDKCPDEAGSAERGGCPEKPKTDKCPDRDKDGLCNDEDECPDLPGPKENKGCPTNDRDKDGIPDDEDKCPDEPGFKAYEGCPMNDRDNDGLRDDLDRCPDEPGPVSNYGCPLGKDDSDGDGVPDEYDQCPNTPGSKERNGCPKISPEQQAALNLAIQNLYFDTDKWIIKGLSKPHLDKLAQVLVQERDWKVHLSGHADARGSDEHNLTLSKNRAESVMYYLMAKGVKREQLVVEYYGERKPAVNSNTASGLALNRRVEMQFIFD